MRIDRNRFLVLTASLSAAACASGAPSAVPAEPVVAEAPPEPHGEEGPAEEPASVTTAEADAGAAPSPVGEGGSPVSEWSPPPSPPTTLSSDKKCNDNVGKPGACTFKAPGPQCESFSDIANECKMIVKAFKPKVAERAVTCMKQKSGTPAICEFALASRCASEAIRNGVCPDKAADAACQQAVSLCGGGRGGGLSMDECRAAYSAVQTKNKKRMMSCVTEFCSIDNCLYQL